MKMFEKKGVIGLSGGPKSQGVVMVREECDLVHHCVIRLAHDRYGFPA
jgi:hypothetical protein